MSRVSHLVNWTMRQQAVGGSESRYALLKRSFPKAELVSAATLSSSRTIQSRRQAVDSYLFGATTEHDVVIKDAGVGGTQDIQAKVAVLFGSPYHTLCERFPGTSAVAYWQELVKAQIEDSGRADLIIANSAFSADDARRVLGPSRSISIVENGVDTEYFKPLPRRRELRPNKHVIWVGSKVELKGRKRAEAIVKAARVPALFIDKASNFSHAEMLRQYQRAAVFLCTSEVEGNSNAVLEALACDVPLLTTACGLFSYQLPSYMGHHLSGSVKEDAALLRHMFYEQEAYEPRNAVFICKWDYNAYAERMQNVVSQL